MFVFHSILSIWAFIQAGYEFGMSELLFQHMKVSIGNSLEPFLYAKKRNVEPRQRYYTPVLLIFHSFLRSFQVEKYS